jgi:hypothetical protein
MKRLLAHSITAVTLMFSVSIVDTVEAQETWRGLVVTPENRCSPYDKKSQYPYPQSVEDKVVDLMGGRIYGPYTGRYFSSDRETDIEHIVAASEGHDSGLCSASAAIKRAFATDPLNLTLAAPEVNRCGSQGKCGLDAGEWLPLKNRCWFANRVVEIKQRYRLTVDRNERDSLQGVMERCDSFDMIFYDDNSTSPSGNSVVENAKNKINTFIVTGRSKTEKVVSDIKEKYALAMYDDNENGRITCAEARAHDIAPVQSDHPAYPFMYDADGDGTVCE